MKIEEPKIQDFKIEKSGSKNSKIEKIETKKFYQNTNEGEIFELDNDLQIYEALELVGQNAATIDYEDDGFGKIRSVTVRKVLDKSVIFYSDQERDIKRLIR